MSIETSQRVWTESRHTGSALLALLALADRADDDGYCWPSIADIAQRARVSERQVKRILEQLEASGELYIVRSAGRGRKSEYLVLTGQSPEKIVRALIVRLGAEVGDAQLITAEIMARQKGDTQGEKVTSASPFERKKGDIQGQKKVTSSALKGDIQGKKVTSSALKGDMAPEKSVDERKEPSERTPKEPSEGTRSGMDALFDFTDDPALPLPPKEPVDRSKIVAGKIPAGMGETPAEVYFEFYPYTDSSLNRLTLPVVTETVHNLHLWREAIQAWMMEGNKPTNINGQLDWYTSGKRSNKTQNQTDRKNHSFNGASQNGNHDPDPQPQFTDADREAARHFRAKLKAAQAESSPTH